MLAKNIRALRESLGYTQVQIANYLEITPQAITQYEAGTRAISVNVVSKLALLFNVEEYDLYEDTPQQHELLSVFAFRANELNEADLKSISEFKKIVLNYINLSNAICDEQ